MAQTAVVVSPLEKGRHDVITEKFRVESELTCAAAGTITMCIVQDPDHRSRVTYYNLYTLPERSGPRRLTMDARCVGALGLVERKARPMNAPAARTPAVHKRCMHARIDQHVEADRTHLF